jgi:sugar lactone lactonase YvrE
VTNVARWDPERKVFHPHNYTNLNPTFYRGGSELRLVSASKSGGIVMTAGTDVYRMGLDGGHFQGPFPMWSKAANLKNPRWNVPQLAVSPDGRYVYYANVAGTRYKPKDHKDFDPRWPQGRVYRQDTKAGDDPQKFYDLVLPDWEQNKYWLPDAWNKRTAAYGICTDAQGHLYVCDLVNQAIVEVDPQGKQVGATPAPWPERIHVDPKTGDYYIISRLDRPKDGRVPKKLIKISGRGPAAKTVAQMPLRRGLGEASAFGTFDGKPVLWIGGGGALICIQDAGTSFNVVQTELKPQPGAQLDWRRIAVDHERDDVYVNNGESRMWRYNGKTGAAALLTSGGKPFWATDLAVGYDGLLYVRRGHGYALGSDYSGPFERYTRDLRPAPYEQTGTHVLSKYIYSRYGIGYAERGIGVAPDGKVYISWMYQGWVTYAITGFDSDGRPLAGKYLVGKCHEDNHKRGAPTALNSAIIGPITASNGGIRVDLAGNLYVGLWLWPKGHPRPAGFRKDRAYVHSTGSVVKFTPAGGFMAVKSKDWGSDFMDVIARTPGAQGLAMHSGGRPRPAFVEGAVRAYPGLAPFSHTGFGGNSCCVCRSPRFDLDRYGRLAMPNAVTNSVTVLDNAGNRIVEFGAYGNFDSQYVNRDTDRGKAGKPTVATPEIPLGWPTGVGVSEDHIYVNDTYNRRVVRVDKTFAAEAACPIP